MFLGTGEAFSERANTSILVDDKLLLDCGLTTLQQLMKIKFDLDKIKAVYITHFHADHCFGLPSFLITCGEESRESALKIFAPSGAEEYIKNLLNLAYRKTLDDFNFRIDIHEIKEGLFNGYKFSSAPMKHSIPCMAVSIESDVDKKKLVYTGDGSPTREVINLARNSSILIAEAYRENTEGHSSILEAAKFARESDVEKLALVHISRKEDMDGKLEDAKKIFPKIIAPKDLTLIKV